MRNSFLELCRDISDALASVRFWLFLALEDIRRQYRRTIVGPLWITVSNAVLIGAFAVIWAQLFGQPLRRYLEYVALGHILYAFMNSSVIELASTFTSSEGYLRQLKCPKFGFVIRVVARNLVTLVHNVPILVGVYLFSTDLTATLWAFGVLGFALVCINLCFVGFVVGAIAVRFRDVPMILASCMQVGFFLTPVIWRTDALSPEAAFYISFNPLAVALSLMRDPWLGVVPPVSAYIYACIWTLVSLTVFILVGSRVRDRIVYWL